MTFAQPWFLLLLLAVPATPEIGRRTARDSAFLYSSTQLTQGVAFLRPSFAATTLRRLRWLALALLIIALARPQRPEGESRVTASGIDIVIALDLSQSMAAEDFEVRGRRANRVAAAKDVIEQFIARRPGDRIGIVAFAGQAYVAAPLTLDHRFLLQGLGRLRLGLIEDGTAIGSGLAASLNRLRDVPSRSRIVILMTDGQNNAGKISPELAAESAKALGVKTYTIGVGTRGTAPMPQVDAFGNTRYVRVDVNIDEDTLKKIAEGTGGKYYRATDARSLREIYGEIDQLEKSDVETKQYQQFTELFGWFAVPGLVLLLLEFVLGHTVWRKLP